MSKNRKTRQEKIILQLKRKLNKQQIPESVKTRAEKPAGEPRQEAIFEASKNSPPKSKIKEKPDKSIFFYDPKLVKKDLLKTLGLTLGILGLEIMLYLKLK